MARQIKQIKQINLFEFSKRLRKLASDPDNRIVLFLGAGCSVSSDIPAAGKLTQKWIKELYELEAGEGVSFKDWQKQSKTFREYKEDIAASFYSKVIKELFPSEEERQKEIEKIVSKHDPGFAYAVLAKLMEHSEYSKNFNKIFTTNFDDLVADALYIYSNKKPLVITHESLIGYARITSVKPTVIKLHGDAHLSPKNTSGEIKELDEGIKNAIKKVLEESFLVFFGYGGNDEGILNSLKTVTELKDKVYWVNDEIPGNSFGSWLKDINATWVNHLDFDTAMLLIHQKFDLEPPEQHRFDQLITKCRKTLDKLEKTIETKTSPQDKTQLTKIFDDVAKKFTDWYAVELEAEKYKKSDPEKADQIYREGLIRFPDSHQLMGNYANFLKTIRKDYDRAEEFYQKTLKIEPESANNLGTYASFLKLIRKDYDKAEEFYKKSLKIDPEDAIHLGNYAGFLLAQGRKQEGKEYLNRSIGISKNSDEDEGVYLECLFYSFAYFPEENSETVLKSIKSLLENGVRSEYWDFEPYIQQAEKEGHPQRDFLKQLKEVINDKAKLSTLNKYFEKLNI